MVTSWNLQQHLEEATPYHAKEMPEAKAMLAVPVFILLSLLKSATSIE
jgi:hypothetical protein